jgi:hypothetical protein
MRFGSVWIGFEKSIQNPIQRFSQKEHPNTSKNIRFFAVFSFFGSVCGFYLDWFEFEQKVPSGKHLDILYPFYSKPTTEL